MTVSSSHLGHTTMQYPWVGCLIMVARKINRHEKMLDN